MKGALPSVFLLSVVGFQILQTRFGGKNRKLFGDGIGQDGIQLQVEVPSPMSDGCCTSCMCSSKIPLHLLFTTH